MPGSSDVVTDVVTIESLGAGGNGVAHLADGMIVFVPRTAPGDRVRLREIRRHKRHAEAQVAEIVAAGPDRIEPACRHYVEDRCGGCQWQHVAMPAQLAAKAAIVGNALRRIGKFDVADPDIVPSPRPFHYRTTMTLTVRQQGPRVIAGFHDYLDPDRVFMLDTCPIAREEINALWQETKPRLGSLPSGDDVRLKLRIGRDGSRQVAVSGGESGGADREALEFLQVNAEVAAMLHAEVGKWGSGEAGKRRKILDLYAGAGETAVPLARAGHDVVMVEMDHRGVEQAEAAAKAAGVKLKCIVGRVEDHVAHLLPADVVIVNPPRTGLSEDIASAISRVPASRLVYVSCDPATLARDLKRMGYDAGALKLVRAYDMFPQTSHVETLVVADR